MIIRERQALPEDSALATVMIWESGLELLIQPLPMDYQAIYKV
jgi:hypothetical protein